MDNRKVDVAKSTSFLEDVQYYQADTASFVVGRARWRRPAKSEAAQFLESPSDKASYFDRTASKAFSHFSSAPLPLDIPLDSPQEESLLPPSWPESRNEQEPINVGFQIASDATQKARQQYEIQVRKLLWDLNIAIIPHIATKEDEDGNRIVVYYTPAGEMKTYRELYGGKLLHEAQLDEFIEDILLAMKLVEEVHRHRLLLRSIRPDIFLRYRTADDGVKKLSLGGTDGLIRLGTSMTLGIASEDASDAWLVKECASYLAPELLGRSSRKVDYRSDVYSFGLAVYELIANQLPAAGSDFLQKVHAILAVEPPPLSEIAPHMPPELAQIVTKMIQKDPAKRYISMRSVRHDIEQLQKFRKDKVPFSVGEVDQLARLELSEDLVGMEHQSSLIETAYRQAAAGDHCLLSIRGASGTGKTSIATQTIHACQGTVFYGKYDLAEHNAFLAPVRTILNSLLVPLISLKEEELDVWRHRLIEAIGQPLVPFFLILLDRGLRHSLRLVDTPESSQTQSRGHKEFLPASFRSATYSSIIRVIGLFTERDAQEESRLRYRPLVLLIDDIQWATPDDLLFYEQLAQPSQGGGMLVIYAFRDGQGSQSFLDSSFRRELCSLRYSLETTLLDQNDVLSLLSKILLREPKQPTEKLKELSQVIHQQTLGNGNHIRNLLTDLYSQEMIFFDWDRLEWDWHYGRDSRLEASTTLGAAEVLEAMLRAGTDRGKTADSLRRTLFCAAAVASQGGKFSCKLVAIATDESVQDVLAMVKSLADSGRIFTCSGTASLGLRSPTSALIESQDESLIDRWSWVHDSIQQAAGSLLAEQARTNKHWVIGNRLLSSLEKDDPLVAEIALYNLNEAYVRGRVLSAEDASNLIALNLASAQNALLHGASEIASRHADLAHRIWKGSQSQDSTPPLDLMITLTDCCTFSGDYERAAAYGEAAIAVAQGAEEKLRAAYCHVKAFLNANDKTALDLLYRYIKTYAGIDMTAPEGRRAYLIQWLETWIPPQGHPLLSEDKVHLYTASLINSGVALAFTSDPIHAATYVCETAYFHLHSGTFTSHTGLALNVLVLFLNGLGEYAMAQKFTQFCKHMVLDLPCSPHQHVENEAGFAANWYDVETCAGMGIRLAENARHAIAIGHLEFGAYSFGTGGLVSLFAGTRNPQQDSEITSTLSDRISSNGAILAQMPGQAAQVLASSPADMTLLQPLGDPEARTMLTQQYHCLRLWLGLILDQIDSGSLIAGFTVKDIAPGNSPWQSLRFLYAVTIYDLARASRLPDQAARVHLAGSLLEGWERTASTVPTCPNFAGPLAIMKAAKDEYLGRYQSALESIDSAIDVMVDIPSLMLAHANERGARIIFQLSGSKRAATPYLVAARAVYQAWDVPHKVKLLSEQLSQVTTSVPHPHLPNTYGSTPTAPPNPSPGTKSSSGGARSSSSGSDSNAIGELVDLSSLVAVVTTWQSATSAQAVSRSLIEILLKSLGCRYGALALVGRDKVCRLAAFGDMKSVETDLNTNIDSAGTHAPATVLTHVARLKQPLTDIALINSNPTLRNDPFFRLHKPLSVIALPIHEGARFSAVAYLDSVRENAFASSKTSEMISLLAVGAATAIARITLLEDLDREKANLENTVRTRSATAEALAARASHAQQAQARFLLTMSHELRSPLNSVIVLSDLLLEANLQPVYYDYVNTIKESSNDLLSVIRDILDYSRLESDQVKLEKLPFDLLELLDMTLDQLSETAAGKSIELVNATSFDTTPPLLVADSTRIKQCLLNLIGNALKFTPNGGAVSLVASSEPLTPLSQNAPARLRVQLAVTDNGIGVAPQKMALLFRSFSQVDDSITRLYGGSGLGLAIVRQLAILMGGDAWCTSELGKGSTFFFSFEAELSNKGVSTHTADLLPAKNTFARKKAVILSPAALTETRKVLISNLAFLGFTVEAWTDSEPDNQEAVDLDLVVFVAVMPPLMTAKRIKRLSSLNPGCRFIILSNKKQQSDPFPKDGTDLIAAPETLSLPIRHRQLALALSRLFQRPQRGMQDELPKAKPPAKLLIPRLVETCPFTILCVDDNAVNIKVLGQLLTRLGYKDFGIARDGQEAIEACRARAFELVLMDLQMPKCDGNTAMRTIKAEQPDGPLIVAVTAHAHSGAKEVAIASGFDAYISKPIILQTLLSTFREMYEKKVGVAS